MPGWPVCGDELSGEMVGAKFKPVGQQHICMGCEARATEVVIMADSPYFRTGRTKNVEMTVFFSERLYHKQGRPQTPPTLEAHLGLTLDTTTTKHA